MRKDNLFDLNFTDWFFTRLSWPGGMLVSSVFFSNFATKDSFKGFVGCVGILDTNAIADHCLLAVPSNDDSVDWVVFVNDVFSEYILLKKLWAVLRWYYFLIKRSSFFPFFEKWVSFRAKKVLVFNQSHFSKKIFKYNMFFFPLWFISSFNAGFFPIFEKMDVLHTGVDVVFSKNIIKNLFNNLIIKKKMVLSFSTRSFFGRSFFFSSDVSENILGFSNWENHSFFKFSYCLYNRWFLNKQFSPFLRKFQRNDFFYFFYLNNISFLSNFSSFYTYQRFSFFFRQNFYNLNNWWELFFYSFYFFSYFIDWNVILQKNKKKITKTSRFLSSYFSSKRFFLLDPLHSDFYYNKVRFEKRHFFKVNLNFNKKNLENFFFVL